MKSPMRIEVRIAQSGGNAMHALLARRLAALGNAVRFIEVGPPAPTPTGLSTLFTLEDVLYGRTERDLSGAWPLPRPEFDGEPDLLIQLDGEASKGPTPRLSLMFDGVAGEAAAIAAVLFSCSPEISVSGGAPDCMTTLATGVPALPFPFRLKDSLGRIRARQVDLIILALRRLGRGETVSAGAVAKNAGTPVLPLVFGVRALATKIAGRLQRLAGGANDSHWRVAFRRTQGDAVQDCLRWPDAPWSLLPDDGKRYFADPFLVARDGALHLFVEEYPYATGKGFISVATLGADGVFSTPRPILETGVHLSYPFVFDRDGVTYMLPESTGARELRLYRAERFPDVWVPDRVLIPDIVAADATLFESNDRIWLLASLSHEGQSDWDSLDIFHAPSLDGPFAPLADNPVLVDGVQARGGGRFFEQGGAIFRPAQDCSRGYGSALALCRVDRFDATGFAQTVVARLACPPIPGCRGVHTLNAADGFEAIDLLGGDFRTGQKFSFVNQGAAGAPAF